MHCKLYNITPTATMSVLMRRSSVLRQQLAASVRFASSSSSSSSSTQPAKTQQTEAPQEFNW